ncbi:MAG: oxidoreductase, partial [Marinilabiliaceae bacterium]|nr:oxidoreductase [Marinilabiliaceae bacterium]
MSSERKRKKLTPVSVIDISEISSGVYYLKLERIVDFIPGQVIALAMQTNLEPRLYSIASGLKDNYIGILFDINPDGELTPQLAALTNGDPVFASDPFGKFNCSPDRAVWIATGTGIAPFISMVRSGRTRNVQLIHGARYL